MINWENGVESAEDKELKQLARDIYDNKVLTDRHLSEHDQHLLPVIFMPMGGLMGPQPPDEPNPPNDKPETLLDNRENKLYELVDREKKEEEYEKDMKVYEKELKDYQEKYIPTIGLIYEYLDTEQGSRGINGYPSFFSMRMLNKEDTVKMFDYLEKYREKRKVLDTDF